MSKESNRCPSPGACTLTHELAVPPVAASLPEEEETRLFVAASTPPGQEEETRLFVAASTPPEQEEETRLFVAASMSAGSAGHPREERGKFDWSRTTQVAACDSASEAIAQAPEHFPLLGVMPQRRREGPLPASASWRAMRLRPRHWIWVALGSAALGIATFVVLAAGGEPPQVEGQVPEAPTPADWASLQRFEEGLEAFRDGAYEEALEKFRAVEDEGGAEARRYIERIEREVQTRKALDRAASCLARGDLLCAEESMARADADTRTYRERMDEARGFLASAWALVGQGPSKDLGGEASSSAPDTLATPAVPPAAAAASAPAAKAGSSPKSGRSRSKRPARTAGAKGPQASSATQAVVELVRQSDEEGGSRSIQLLEEAWSQVRGLEGAAALERQVRDRLASASYQAAEDAQRMGALLLVVRHLQRTLEANPGHAPATTWLATLQTQAEDLFWDGYSLRERNPAKARERLEVVRALTRQRDPLHRKATKWLQALDGSSHLRAGDL